jgi:DNA repair exonuclease SbcCD nuclease subunit
MMGDYCLKNEIENFIIGGDIMHSKSIIYSIAQKLMLDFFEHYKDLTFWVIDGNHDLSGKGSDAISSLRSLSSVDNVVWIHKTPVGNDDFLCIPYSSNIVDQVKQNNRKILISHFGLSEGVLNSGISIVSDIKIKDLINKYKLVLLGHYHKPQEIKTEDINLFYVGSPIQLDWGEKDDEKRFLVIDTETLDVQSILTTGYKKHVELEINNKNKNEILEIAKQAEENGDYVKIIKTEAVDLQKTNFAVIDKTEKDITNRGITSTMSDRSQLQKYLEIKEIPSDKHEAYLKKGLEIINSCEGE